MKLFYKSEQNGRSMIEMFGVLAIVGILSVGGLSGFNKAMTKYQAGKWVDEVLISFQEFIRYRDDWVKMKSVEGGMSNVNAVMQTMVPSGWVLSSNGMYFRSKSGEMVSFFSSPAMHFYVSKEHSMHMEYCFKLFTDIIIPYADAAHLVHKYFIDSSGTFSSQRSVYGDDYCKPSVKCIRNLTLSDIIDICTPTEEEREKGCSLYMTFYLSRH